MAGQAIHQAISENTDNNNEITNKEDSKMTENIERWQKIIAELCTNASDQSVKDCLRKYDSSKTTKELTSIFKKCLKTSILSTLNFLGLHPDGNVINKDELVDILIQRVKNFFPDLCSICENEYCFKFNDSKFLACSLCGQEVHKTCYVKALNELGLINENDKNIKFLEIPGFHFLCGACEEETVLTIFKNTKSNQIVPLQNPVTDNSPVSWQIPDQTPSQETSLNNETHFDPGDIYPAKRNNSPQTMNAPMQLNTQNSKPLSNTDDDVQDEVIETTNIIKNHRTDFMRNRIKQNKELEEPLESFSNLHHKPESSESKFDHIGYKYSQNESQKVNKLCYFFEKGRCKHGIKGNDCNYTHPQFCKKLMQHGTRQPNGCNKGKSCQYFHPAMCIESLRKSQCFNEHCKFYHVKGTARNRNASNNHPQYSKNTYSYNKANDNHKLGNHYQHEIATNHTEQVNSHPRYSKNSNSYNKANNHHKQVNHYQHETETHHTEQFNTIQERKNITNNRNFSSNNLNFLEIIHNFKKEIMEEFEIKIAKALSLNKEPRKQNNAIPVSPFHQQTPPMGSLNCNQNQPLMIHQNPPHNHQTVPMLPNIMAPSGVPHYQTQMNIPMFQNPAAVNPMNNIKPQQIKQ